MIHTYEPCPGCGQKLRLEQPVKRLPPYYTCGCGKKWTLDGEPMS